MCKSTHNLFSFSSSFLAFILEARVMINSWHSAFLHDDESHKKSQFVFRTSMTNEASEKIFFFSRQRLFLGERRSFAVPLVVNNGREEWEVWGETKKLSLKHFYVISNRAELTNNSLILSDSCLTRCGKFNETKFSFLFFLSSLLHSSWAWQGASSHHRKTMRGEEEKNLRIELISTLWCSEIIFLFDRVDVTPTVRLSWLLLVEREWVDRFGSLQRFRSQFAGSMDF